MFQHSFVERVGLHDVCQLQIIAIRVVIREVLENIYKNNATLQGTLALYINIRSSHGTGYIELVCR